MSSKIMILSLGRTGSLPLYSDNIVLHFPENSYDYYKSKYAIEGISIPNQKSLITYKSAFSFILNTLFILPFYSLVLLPKIVKNYRILYLPYFHLWNLPFILLFRLLGRDVILTVHDGILHKGENGFLLQQYSNLNIRLSSKLIFLTNYVKVNVEKTLKLIKTSIIVPHGLIETISLVDSPSKINRGKNILFIGRISPYKGVELLAEVIEDIRDKIDKCIIAGKSIYDLKIKDTDKLKIQDKYLSDVEIGGLLNWADILVLPYLEATQSGVITLGISSELPMVCTNVGGFNEQLDQDECIWVEPNKDSLKKGLVHLIENQSQRDYLIKKMHKKKLSLKWDTISLQIFKFLNTNE
ncbi:glycosyltransferase family 4 protein [Apibacter sp. B3706]|uniref:glycosyltransferase family 4 protein n=1 Tax=unclassified Apibacter TaxID=2630820 RepID=UPI00135D4CAD|nr:MULTISPECIES: glycosyltransferase family 4 protein [unclassified Apibacter]MXP06576.1 glycosyltransferase [Apibacter sp. B3546]MXP12801.1 glycosyltransferase [Apibacter sp. B3239]QII69365.1 glycosyltransferase family 4 protein [Apibacter sp. B3706]